MAVYKVPQDVEAEDKLIGPFSFRQFIYLIIVAISGFVAYILAQIFIGLILIPLPVMIFFGVLALPLRKDQPMEVYLAAVVRFMLKPKNRVWKSEGTINLVEVVAPHTTEERRYKDLSQDDAQSRFDYLARVMDSRGWSTRGVMSGNESVNEVVAAESVEANDILDEGTSYAQNLDNRLELEEARRREEAVERMRKIQEQAASLPALHAEPEEEEKKHSKPHHAKHTQDSAFTLNTPPAGSSTAAPDDDQGLVFNPYPSSMHQKVITPHDQQQPADDTPADDMASRQTPADEDKNDTSTATISPDILNLAHNSDLSISAIAHEAERLQQKQDSEEVVISLR